MEVNQEEIVVPSGMFPWKLVMLIVLAAVLITIIVVSVAVYMWREVANQRIVDELQRKLELAIMLQQEQSVGVAEQEEDAVPAVSSRPVKEGWQTYSHSRYNYKIDYPKGAIITESEPGNYTSVLVEKAGEESVVEENVPYLDGLCVVIEYEFGSVSISAPGNRYVVCRPTGVGSDAQQQSKTVTIDGSLLKASGYRVPSQEGQAPSYGWFEFTTENGFSVVYMVNPETEGDEAKYEDVKSVVEEMVASFRSVE